MSPEIAMYTVWIGWVLSWGAASFWTDRTVGRPAQSSQLFYRIITAAGGVVLFGINPRDPQWQLWRTGPEFAWATVALAAAGFAFTWWARLHLGKLWSSSVTKKAGHHVVDTGPYRFVRHPIYTGVITAAFAVFLLKGTLIALAGAAIMTAGFYIKARLEERFLRQELGADTYDAYAGRVAMLVPFIA
jgi:protein-S-isoprenylcysteine O-methyltransferase Ste14